MALRAWHTGWLLAALCAGAAAGGAAPASGTGPAASAAAGSPAGNPASNPATQAAIAAEHHRQRQLCERLTVAAVRAECLRQADRSRDQALARLRPAAAPSSGPRPPALSGSSARSG